MIPEAAVEAAWDKLHENPIRPIGIDYAELEAALEAAAPHMLAEAWDAAIDEAYCESMPMSSEDAQALHARNPYRPAK